jgi:4-aminobutyrate aminotransferase-like enzyme/Ser/Thr protein kinase RdoA (MazF antagonist)
MMAQPDTVAARSSQMPAAAGAQVGDHRGMATPSQLHPQAERVAHLLHTAFGIDGVLKPLPSERDTNFLVEQAGRPCWVAKLMASDEDPRAIRFQTELLRTIERTSPELPVPRVRLTQDQQPWAELPDGSNPPRRLRVLSYLSGRPMAEAVSNEASRHGLGRVLGRLNGALRGFAHPGQFQEIDWDIRKAPACRQRSTCIPDAADRDIVARWIDGYDSVVQPILHRLRHGVIYNDANDWNVLVTDDGREVCGLIDFGDALWGPLVADLAVAMAYSAFAADSPLQAAAEVVAGFDAELPLEDAEFESLFPLMMARLCISVTKSAQRREQAVGNPYLRISEDSAWGLLRGLADVPPGLACAIFRKAAGRSATAVHGRLLGWIGANAKAITPILATPPARLHKRLVRLDGSDPAAAQAMQAADPETTNERWRAYQAAQPCELGVGLWLERRPVYEGAAFESRLIKDQRRDTHLGIDLFLPVGTPVFAPLAGTVVSTALDPMAQGFGGVLLLRHEPEPGLVFFTLWGHLDPSTSGGWANGAAVKPGDVLAHLGHSDVNGGWPPHLHFQLLTLPFTQAHEVPGVCEAALADVWAELSPDPSLFLGLPPELLRRSGRSTGELVKRRAELIGPNLSISYRDAPLKIVRGDDVWLIDDEGRAYLDAYNNVAHVGHEHPRVVSALVAQAQRLNTNTRYLHDHLVSYAERLAATLPAPLGVCYFVNSGSEANDLALRMARASTGRKDMLVLDWAYHGHLESLIHISPYKYKRPGGRGKPKHVHELDLPDAYRASSDVPRAALGEAFARQAQAVCAQLQAAGRAPAAFIAETMPSVAGQIVLPDGYLRSVYAHVRAAGGLCIADEVQVGFGRSGTMWAFEQQGVVPDIVTLGKPIGNGHPMAALITTPAIAAAFAGGMEYFNTFGGNPVSCAVGLAVLDVLKDERLIDNAQAVGAYLLRGLQALMQRHELIGDVRGVGLFMGVELVTERQAKTPATAQARQVARLARDRGVLVGTDGPHDNVIKMRPAMTFRTEHADVLLECLDQCLSAVVK